MDKRQREIVLAVLAVAVIAVVFWRFGSTSSGSAANASADSSPAANAAPRDKTSSSEIDLQGLKTDRPAPQDSDRNPFRFKPKAPPPPAPAMPSSKAIGESAVEAAIPVGPPPPAPIPLKFIGLLSSKDDPKLGRVAILTDGRGVYYGREGEVIEGRYRILKIGVESIDLAYLDGRGRQTIRQTGQ